MVATSAPTSQTYFSSMFWRGIHFFNTKSLKISMRFSWVYFLLSSIDDLSSLAIYDYDWLPFFILAVPVQVKIFDLARLIGNYDGISGRDWNFPLLSIPGLKSRFVSSSHWLYIDVRGEKQGVGASGCHPYLYPSRERLFMMREVGSWPGLVQVCSPFQSVRAIHIFMGVDAQYYECVTRSCASSGHQAI